jgi:hypothetical protein
MEEIQPLEVILGDQVSHIVFNIIQCSVNPVALGLPWFELRNLDVSWNLLKISSKHKKKKYIFNLLFLELGHLNVQQSRMEHLQFMLHLWVLQ